MAPKVIFSKFPSVCTECRQRIYRGDRIHWSPEVRGVKHVACPPVSDYRPVRNKEDGVCWVCSHQLPAGDGTVVAPGDTPPTIECVDRAACAQRVKANNELKTP